MKVGENVLESPSLKWKEKVRISSVSPLFEFDVWRIRYRYQEILKSDP
jgi:hypothetical protein